jgi:hypothetical protein
VVAGLATHQVIHPTCATTQFKKTGWQLIQDGIMKIKNIKSVEEFRDEIDRDAKGSRGRFKILSREMFNSRAFASLDGKTIKVVLAILNKLEYQKKGKSKKKGVESSIPLLRNNGEFSLTKNELIARGLSESSATRGRITAWELGFFDVIEPGTIHHAGRYRYSERWKLYPYGAYQPSGQQPPGKNVYPDKGFKKNDSSISSTANDSDFPGYLKMVK